MPEWLERLHRGVPFDLKRALALIRYVWRNFGRDNCFASAGMLTYNTLLALVPLTTVVLTVLAALPVGEAWTGQIKDFIFSNLLPASQQAIQDKLLYLAQGARSMTMTMAVFLLVTSLMLMATIEKTFNQIWGVQTPRPLTSRFVVFWTSLTVGPILLGASLALSSYLFARELFIEAPAAGVVIDLLRSVTPFIVATVAFLFMFVIVPNRSVPWRHAVLGAILTGLMFELAKWAFGIYATSFDGTQLIYGALAAIPIFIIWIYLSWSVILLGASFTASLGSFRYRRHGESYPPRREFLLLYRLVAHLWQAQAKGAGVQTEALLKLEPGADAHQVQVLLENLRRAQIVRRDDQGEWILVRDLAELTLGDLYATGAYVWPLELDELNAPDDHWNLTLRNTLASVQQPLKEVTAKPLKSFFSPSGSRQPENLRLV